MAGMTNRRFNALVKKDEKGLCSPEERQELVQAALRRADYEHVERERADWEALQAELLAPPPEDDETVE